MKKTILILLLVIIQWFFIRPSFATGACQANDINSFTNCINSVNSGMVDNIEVKSLITCSGVNTCKFTINNINRPVKISGVNGAGFKRIDSFDYGIITINNSNQVILSNLLFDESLGTNGVVQNSTLAVIGSSNIILDKIESRHPRLWALTILSSNHINVTNSTFKDSEIYGIWAPYYYNSESLHIESNLFENNKSNAIMISSISPVNDPTVISYNTFIHNHHNAVFNVCGPSGNGPCSGGQFVIETKADNVIVEGNLVTNGFIDDGTGVLTNGLEFAPSDISNVILKNNTIINNTGWGVVLNSGGVNISNITISGNYLFNNAIANIDFPGATIGQNCFTSECVSYLSLKASILSTPVAKNSQYTVVFSPQYSGFLEVKYTLCDLNGQNCANNNGNAPEKWCYYTECFMANKGVAMVDLTNKPDVPVGNFTLQFRPWGSLGLWSNPVNLTIYPTNKIDITDFRSLLSQFTSIFDYNNIVANYGL